MDLHQLRCFVAAAEELHFGRAAQRLGMMPSALGRHVRLLEDELGTRLLARTTRNVALTDAGAAFLEESSALLAQADALSAKFRSRAARQSTKLRVGAIDSAAVGLVPLLLRDFRERRPDVAVQILEEKTIHLLPRLVSGRLDLALVRPPANPDRSIEFLTLFHETPVVAISHKHRLAGRRRVTIHDLANEPLIVPERRSRPHSHDLTIALFAEAGETPHIAQYADEKQTIVNLVAADLGVAIVPRWTSRMSSKGVHFLRLHRPERGAFNPLPLAAAWIRGSRDPVRDDLLAMLRARLSVYAAQA